MTKSAASTHLRYRADLDGLRAIAVLGVVASHLGINGLKGGYVGVDIFFVISGFLIGSNLLREIAENGRVDYLEFYERRIRRILPALVVMLFAVFFIAYAVLLPKDMLDFSKMGTATLLFSANIYLAQSTGYFGPDAALNLLTHMWSLGVEEQFYILFPPLLTLCRGSIRNGSIGRLLAILAGMSFVASAVSVHYAPTGTFYLLPTRTWELLLGTLTYIYAPRITHLSSRLQGLLASIGLLALVIPVFVYTPWTVFPGLSALPPCAGAVLVIATHSTFVHRLLSLRPCVFFGQISYSLYLWHWPIFVLNRIRPLSAHSNIHLVQLELFTLVMVLSYVSWRWIETPFRRGRFKPARTVLFWQMGGVAVILLGGCFGVMATHGAAYRYSPAEQKVASFRQNGGSMQNFRAGQCFLVGSDTTEVLNQNGCLSLDATRPNYLLLGSSFVAQLNRALRETYPEIHFLQATLPGCYVGEVAVDRFGRECSALLNFVFNDFLAHNHVDGVLFQVEQGQPTPGALEPVIDFFHKRGTKIIVMGPQVRYDTSGPDVAIASMRNTALHVDDHIVNSSSDDQPYRGIVERAGGTYLSMFDTICPLGKCHIFAAPEVPMETDQYHLTYEGTVYVARSWREHGYLLPPGIAK